ncbi:hypothetical protein BN7_1670 [Wickerhamomyces ciferrii]|uniref:Uncharacterized protein n=1 Tax=Wickerhamomyces ciferrii (strain ATCC 14091 / BCRC 22168 / CBS 111 / JCM 3599 / NBRC 0793 / NRRL Y-1031 F-60-10) TaxID=1206466 RepID=K0KGL9_WICCF|nr:uncharacterized protein BN7_1670 [Wickerhamomyces ciferrii]CCH42126.1 hypothetical protein BN7_1670 [Wickerhamomyces ciferrii]
MIYGKNFKVCCNKCFNDGKIESCNDFDILVPTSIEYNGSKGCLELIPVNWEAGPNDRVNNKKVLNDTYKYKFYIVSAELHPKHNEWCLQSDTFKYNCDSPCCETKPTDLYLDDSSVIFMKLPYLYFPERVSDVVELGRQIIPNDLPIEYFNKKFDYYPLQLKECYNDHDKDKTSVSPRFESEDKLGPQIPNAFVKNSQYQTGDHVNDQESSLDDTGDYQNIRDLDLENIKKTFNSLNDDWKLPNPNVDEYYYTNCEGESKDEGLPRRFTINKKELEQEILVNRYKQLVKYMKHLNSQGIIEENQLPLPENHAMYEIHEIEQKFEVSKKDQFDLQSKPLSDDDHYQQINILHKYLPKTISNHNGDSNDSTKPSKKRMRPDSDSDADSSSDTGVNSKMPKNPNNYSNLKIDLVSTMPYEGNVSDSDDNMVGSDSDDDDDLLQQLSSF